MAKRAINVRLRKDQLASIQKIVDADPYKNLDRTAVVSMAVDQFLSDKQAGRSVIRGVATKRRAKKKK